jgi:hypothetical protein
MGAGMKEIVIIKKIQALDLRFFILKVDIS